MTAIRRASIMGDGLSSAGVVNRKIQDDWDTIADICESGKASEYYSIGDYKELDLGTGGVQRMCIVGFNKDASPESSFTTAFLSADLVKPVQYEKGSSYTSPSDKFKNAGWCPLQTPQYSTMEEYYENTIYPSIPQVIRSRIKSVYKPFLFGTFPEYLGYKLVKAWAPSEGEFRLNFSLSGLPVADDTTGGSHRNRSYGYNSPKDPPCYNWCLYSEYCDFINEGGLPAAVGANRETVIITREAPWYVDYRGSVGAYFYVWMQTLEKGNLSRKLIYRSDIANAGGGFVATDDIGYALGFCL